MRKPSIAAFTEIVGATKLAEKLAKRVERDQRVIAEIVADVEGISWPTNILGQMQNLLEQRDYPGIEDLLIVWEKWIETSSTIGKQMTATATVIAAFVEFFQETNGMSWESPPKE